MISGRVERLAGGSSWLHRRAAEAKIAGVAVVTLVVLTEFEFGAGRMLGYGLLTGGLAVMGGLPAGLFVRRLLVVAPVLLLAAALPWISAELGETGVRGVDPRLVLAKGGLAVCLLTVLAASTPFASLLGGLERLRAPGVVRLLAGLMYRYVPLLREEWERMDVARRSRTPGEGRRMGLGVLGRQLANLFLRAWQRADRVQEAMEARAFSGRWHGAAGRAWEAGDLILVVVLVGSAAAIRVSEVVAGGA